MEAIANVLETIRQRLNAYFQNVSRRSDDWVILSNVFDNQGNFYGASDNKIVMLLANIAHETVISTYTPSVRTGTGTYAAVSPPLYIDLFVLFYANFSNANYLQGLRSISRTISYFQQNPAFTRDIVPDLDPAVDKILMEFTNLDMVDSNYLMGMMGVKYLPSVFYKLRMIPFVSGAMQAEIPPAQGVQSPGEPAPLPPVG